MEMTYLITNPFGIGHQLIEKLISKNESVFTVYPSPKEVPMSFLGKLTLKYGFLKFEHDVDLSRILPKRIKYCVHLFDRYSGPFTTLFKANTCATLLLLEWARRVGVERFIYLSSGEVYGQGTNVVENTPYNPYSFYATTKFETEYLFRFFNKSFAISTIRLFFPFGREMRGGLIKNISDALEKASTCEVDYHTICPTFSNDVVEPLYQLIHQEGSAAYNICGQPIDTKTFIAKLGAALMKSPGAFKIGKAVLTGSSEKAEKELGFKTTPLDDAIQNSFSK